MKTLLLTLILPFAELLSQTDESWKIFDDSGLARIDITVDAAKLQWMYANVQSDSEHYAKVHFKNNRIDETVDSVGFRLRGNTSRNSAKKSFKISFNSFVKGREFYGIEKLNLNGEHNDPSIIRSKLCFDLFHDIGMTAPRANHVSLYINGSYYGLYINVEHVDEEFLKKNFKDNEGSLWKCLYPADLKYINGNPDSYKGPKNNETTRAYDLLTNKEADNYSRLAKLINIINNTPAVPFADSLEKYLDVRRVLQYFAMNTLVGGWDDYRFLKNNYYLYHIPSENKFTIIPYDYDNTFGIDWFNTDWTAANPYSFPTIDGGSRPLAEKMMANDQYRDLFTHFLLFYRNNVLALPLWETRIDRIRDTISAAAALDAYRTLDYGFTVDDFNNSYSATSYSKSHVKFGLKQFINARSASLSGQLTYKNAPPILYTLDYLPRHPLPADSIVVVASCFSAVQLKEVIIKYFPGGSLSSQDIPMNHAPGPNAKLVEEADRWVGVIPPLGAGNSGTFQILVKDSFDQTQLYPRTSSVEIKSSAVASPSVVINEIMADNTTIADSAGQFDDWIELYNPTSSPVTLTNKYLTDKADNLTKKKFLQPDLILAPGEYLIVWCDEDSSQKGIHTNFKLSAGGEYLALTDSDGVTVLDSLTFGGQTTDVSLGRFPDGAAAWGFMTPTPWLANSALTSVNSERFVPEQFHLSVYPNPFNPSTTISYALPEAGEVTMRIFDLLGRSVWSAAAGIQNAGAHTVQWNGTNNAGYPASSGIYFLRVHSGNYSAVKKLILIK